MKTHLDIRHDGTLGNQDRTRMTFDENSIAHLMSVLTDLYSNPSLAVVREYSTNALDAHRAAGNTAPIEITLPSPMLQTLSIKDHGIGMSASDITDNFSKYGWSSKRDTDNEVGMLGIGCKAGLAYTSQFTIVTSKGGVTTTVLVTREESGGGVVQIIDSSLTGASNGTEVIIPVKNRDDIGSTAREFFQYWDEGTVLVNGEPPRCIWNDPPEDAIRLDEDVILIPTVGRRENERRTLVMGGISYGINMHKMPYGHVEEVSGMTYVVRVPIGTVNFVPSRESLQYTKRTIETINDINTFIQEGMSRKIQHEIDAASTPREAFGLWMNWRYVFGRSHKRLTYKGDAVSEYIDVADPGKTLRFPVRPYNSWEADRSERLTKNLKLADCYDAVLHVVGHKGTSVMAPTKAKIRKYCDSVGITKGNVLVYPTAFGAPWLTNTTVRRVRFDVIQAIELSDEVKTKTAAAPRFRYRILCEKHIPKGKTRSVESYGIDALPDTVVCWVTSEYATMTMQQIYSFAGQDKVAVVTPAESARFLKNHPDLPHFEHWVKNQMATVHTTGNDVAHFWWHYGFTSHRSDTMLPEFLARSSADLAKKLLDPELADLVRQLASSRFAASTTEFTARMEGARKMQRVFPEIKVGQVPTSTIFRKIKKASAFYEGMLEIFISTSHAAAFTKGLNAIYVLKSQLHVIPVY